MSSYFSEAFLESLSEPRLNPCASSFQPRGADKALDTSSPLFGSAGHKVEFYYPNPRASSGLKAYVNSRFCDVSRRDAELLGLLAPRRPLAKNLVHRACSYCYSRSTHFCWHPFKDNCNRIICPLISYKLAVLKNYRKHRAPNKTTLKQNPCNLSVSMAASISSEESDATFNSLSSSSERRSSLQSDSGVSNRESLKQRAALAQEADRQTCEAEFYKKLQECEREYSSKSSGEMMMYMPVSERIANRSRQLSSTIVTSSKDKGIPIPEQNRTSRKFFDELPTSSDGADFFDKSKKEFAASLPLFGIPPCFPSVSFGGDAKPVNKIDCFNAQWKGLENDGRDEIPQSSLPSGIGTSSGIRKPSNQSVKSAKVIDEFKSPVETSERVSTTTKMTYGGNLSGLLTDRWAPVPNNKSSKLQVPSQNLNKTHSSTEELRQALLFLRKHLANSNVFAAIVSNKKEIVVDSIKSLECSIIQFSVLHQQTEHGSLANMNPCKAISYLNKLIEVRKDEVISLLGASCNNSNERRLGLLINSLDENCYVQDCKFHKFNRQRYWQDLNHLCDFFFICCGKERHDRILNKVLELLRSIDNDSSNSLGQIYINFLSSEMAKDVRRKLLESNGKPLYYLVDFIEYCKLYLKVCLLKLQVQKPAPSRDLNNNVISSPIHAASDENVSASLCDARSSIPGTSLAKYTVRNPCSEFLSLRPRLFPQLAGKTSMAVNESSTVNGSNNTNELHSPLLNINVDKGYPEVCASVSVPEVPSMNTEETGKRSRYNILVMCKLETAFKNLRIFDYIIDNNRAIVWNRLEKVFSVQNDCGVGGVCGNRAFIKDIEDRLIVRRDGHDLL